MRLSLALEEGLTLPEQGDILVLNGGPEQDYADLDMARLHFVQPLRPAYEALENAGCRVDVAAKGPYAAAIVFLPRAKALARAMVAEACEKTPGGLIIIDGQKTDGIDSMFKECRKRATASAALSKAHGKLFWFTANDGFADWSVPETPREVAPGFVTRPGVFSADGIDPGSAALAAALPEKLGSDVADLGAGWGWLTAQILTRKDVKSVEVVEADHIALECARQNISDPRARFLWADATHLNGIHVDGVVMNPPFHTGRAAEPALGAAFIATAARILKPRGRLWMVANRHLPYETHLRELFQTVTELDGTSKFKILMAEGSLQKSRPQG